MTKVSMDFVSTCASKLWEAQAKRIPTLLFTEEYPDFSVDSAYKVQLLNVKRKLDTGDRLVGHKIGLTSKPMQQMLGVNEPDYGHLFKSMWYDTGATIDYPLLQPKVEPEIAFVLKEDLAGPDVSLYDVLRATDYVVPAIEVIDSRIADWKIKLPDTIADNASSGCFVVGDQMIRITDIDLTTIGMAMRRNGEIVQTGAGAAVLGHPALAVAWLANKLADYDTVLRAGQLILSGAVSAAVAVNQGDRVQVLFGKMGRVDARF